MEMPISQPRPNSPPSVKRVEALTLDDRAVHSRREAGGAFPTLRDKGLAVVRGMLRNVAGWPPLRRPRRPTAQHIVQKFRVELRVRRDAEDGRRFSVAAQADRGALHRGRTRRFCSMGRNLGAMARWTSRTSAALQTDGRLVFAFSMILSAISRSALSST